ncbi:MAG TPA: hypothetical protein PLN56_08570 [Methanoregulaceae archaeon]|nr:hypothetical protein [Methanothrix sp.]HOL44672.1 hypothetical protein [Methanothrix sp.]HON93887.1 hypothetical protein [Sedimentisphaerales bacterium]HPD11037.1 hypothetical protein [Methanoregulaceae archaeon]
MLSVEWKIGRKKRGNWNTPLYYCIKSEGKELQLRPHLVFRKNYALPDRIILSQRSDAEIYGYHVSICKEIENMSIKFDHYIDKPLELDVVSLQSICGMCRNLCQAYLPWRPGVPDYSDYEEVFRQMAIDLCEAWNRAVAEAMESEEYKPEPVIISSENYLNIASVVKPSRKLKIA